MACVSCSCRLAASRHGRWRRDAPIDRANEPFFMLNSFPMIQLSLLNAAFSRQPSSTADPNAEQEAESDFRNRRFTRRTQKWIEKLCHRFVGCRTLQQIDESNERGTASRSFFTRGCALFQREKLLRLFHTVDRSDFVHCESLVCGSRRYVVGSRSGSCR
jgi:hypothetical protein